MERVFCFLVLIVLFVPGTRLPALECSGNVGPSVAVLGAGPAGLTLGYFLQAANVPFVLLERGPSVGHSWTRMPTQLRLVSYWAANRLPGGPPTAFRDDEQVLASAFAEYLRRYAEVNALPVRTGVDVRSVSRSEGGFRIVTATDEYRTPYVVNATGYFSRPVRPEYPGFSSIPQRHSAEFKDAATLRSELPSLGRAPRVLVVGQRLTAGQLLVELVDAGFAVSLSHRSSLRFGLTPETQQYYLANQLALEGNPLTPALWRPSPHALMDGGRPRTLLESGAVRRFPEILRFDGETVIFQDGSRASFDAILYATGFRPALAHLEGLVTIDEETGLPPIGWDLQSTDAPGMYFLGLDRVRTFRSRFLRGIREDAPLLANALAAQLRATAAVP